MSATGIIKEYLVKLGFTVDQQQFGQFERTFNNATKINNLFATSTTAGMAAASVAVIAFVASANAAIGTYIDKLAKADMDTEIWARRMWISTDQAKAIMEAQKATGRSLEEVWYSPELRSQFVELQKVAREMRPPEGFKEQMQFVRSIQLEWMKLRVMAAYAMQHIGYYLTKYLSGPLSRLKKMLKDAQVNLKLNLPKIADSVAKFLANFVRVGEAIMWAIMSILNLINKIPGNVKSAVAIVSAIMAVVMSGPVGWIIAGLSMILLLLEDFYTYSQGGKSAFPEMWKWVSDTFGEGSETAIEFSQSLEYLNTQLGYLRDYLTDIYEEFQKHNVFAKIGDTITSRINTVKAFANAIKMIVDALKEMYGLKDFKLTDMFPDMENALSGHSVGEKLAKGTNFYLDWQQSLSETLMNVIRGISPIRSEAGQNKQSINQTIENTNNIYGSDAYAIGTQVNNQWENMFMMRDLQGVYR